MAALLAASGPRERALFGVLGLAGLRASELRGLRWADIDFSGGTITVSQRADRWGNIGSSKSVTARRAVPIGPALVRMLKEWRLACTPGELAFPNGAGRVEELGNLRTRDLEPALAAAGLPRFGVHAFRHFYASWSLARGDPLATVQKHLGHSTVTLTADTYGHLLPRGEAERKALAAAEAALIAGLTCDKNAT